MMERRTITRAPLAMVLESSSFFPFVKPMVVLFRFYTWMPFLSYDLCFSLLLSQQKWKKKWGELNCSPPSKNHQALCPRPDIDLGTCLFFFFFFLFCFFCQLSFVLWNLQKKQYMMMKRAHDPNPQPYFLSLHPIYFKSTSSGYTADSDGTKCYILRSSSPPPSSLLSSWSKSWRFFFAYM